MIITIIYMQCRSVAWRGWPGHSDRRPWRSCHRPRTSGSSGRPQVSWT